MYEDFLETILIYIKALNAADAQIAKLAEAQNQSRTFPGIAAVPVIFEGVLVGHLVDEIGGAWSYVEEPAR